MSRLRDISRNEEGVAMVVAIGVLSVMLILTATVMSSSNLLSSATNTDGLRKKAFEAAEAGLQATVYRLNMLAPAADKCIGGPGETVQSPSGVACASYTENLGNGASFTSWTTAALGSSGSCAGTQVGNSSSIAERCVTSAGTVDGVTRRVQTRVASYASAPVFPAAGVVGLSKVDVQNNGHVYGASGSNGQVVIKNNASTASVTVGPSAPNPSVSNNGSSGPVYRRTTAQGPFALAPVDPGNSVTSNDNGRLSNAFAIPSVSPFDYYDGTVAWNPVARTLVLSNNASVTLGGGIYNFCRLSMANNTKITLSAGARTAIYIDSPQRAGSGCAASTGTFTMENNAEFINNSPSAPGSNLAHDPTALQLYVVGKTGATVGLSNNATFYGTLYAPTSKLDIKNNVTIYGALAANEIYLSNNVTVTGDPNAANITTSGGGVFFRSAWRECLSAATTSNPGSGC